MPCKWLVICENIFNSLSVFMLLGHTLYGGDMDRLDGTVYHVKD